MATRLRARVTTGLGKAQSNVGASAASVAAALGLPEVYPGTLNLELEHPFEVPVGAHPVILPSLGARQQPFYFYPAELAGRAVWVARSLSSRSPTIAWKWWRTAPCGPP